MICGILFVTYGSTVFSSSLANVEKIEMGLYESSCFGMCMMLASFIVFDGLLDLWCVACSLLMFVYYSVCIACYMFYCVCEKFAECICYLSRCGSCSVVEYYGTVLGLGRPFIAHVLFSIVCMCFVTGPTVCSGVLSRCLLCLFAWGKLFQSHF